MPTADHLQFLYPNRIDDIIYGRDVLGLSDDELTEATSFDHLKDLQEQKELNEEEQALLVAALNGEVPYFQVATKVAQRRMGVKTPEVSATAAAKEQLTGEPSFEIDRRFEDENWGQFAERKIEKGFLSTKAALAGAGATVGALVGSKSIQEAGLDSYFKAIEDVRKLSGGVESYDQVEGFGDAVDLVAGFILENLPNMALIVAGGGVPSAGAKIAAKQAVKRGIANKVIKRIANKKLREQALDRLTSMALNKIGRRAAAAGTLATTTALEAGSIFGDIVEAKKQAGENPTGTFKEALTAAGFGAVAGALDSILPMAVMKKFGIDSAMKVHVISDLLEGGLLKSTVGGALFEGSTEAIQTVIERSARKFLDSEFQVFDEEGKKEIWNAIIAGVSSGGVYAAPGGAMTSIQQRGMTAEQKKSLREQRKAREKELEGVTVEGELTKIEEAQGAEREAQREQRARQEAEAEEAAAEVEEELTGVDELTEELKKQEAAEVAAEKVAPEPEPEPEVAPEPEIEPDPDIERAGRKALEEVAVAEGAKRRAELISKPAKLRQRIEESRKASSEFVDSIYAKPPAEETGAPNKLNAQAKALAKLVESTPKPRNQVERTPFMRKVGEIFNAKNDINQDIARKARTELAKLTAAVKEAPAKLAQKQPRPARKPAPLGKPQVETTIPEIPVDQPRVVEGFTLEGKERQRLEAMEKQLRNEEKQQLQLLKKVKDPTRRAKLQSSLERTRQEAAKLERDFVLKEQETKRIADSKVREGERVAKKKFKAGDPIIWTTPAGERRPGMAVGPVKGTRVQLSLDAGLEVSVPRAEVSIVTQQQREAAAKASKDIPRVRRTTEELKREAALAKNEGPAGRFGRLPRLPRGKGPQAMVEYAVANVQNLRNNQLELMIKDGEKTATAGQMKILKDELASRDSAREMARQMVMTEEIVDFVDSLGRASDRASDVRIKLSMKKNPNAKADWNPSANTLTIYADNVLPSELPGLMRHELMVHAFGRALIGPEYDNFLRRVLKEEPAAVAETRALYRNDSRIEDELFLAEETVGRLAETGEMFKDKHKTTFQKLVDMIRRALRKLGFSYDDSTVRSMMQEAYKDYAKNYIKPVAEGGISFGVAPEGKISVADPAATNATLGVANNIYPGVRMSVSESVQAYMEEVFPKRTKETEQFVKVMGETIQMTSDARRWIKETMPPKLKQDSIWNYQKYLDAHPEEKKRLGALAKSVDANIYDADGNLIPSSIETLTSIDNYRVVAEVIENDKFLSKHYKDPFQIKNLVITENDKGKNLETKKAKIASLRKAYKIADLTDAGFQQKVLAGQRDRLMKGLKARAKAEGINPNKVLPKTKVPQPLSDGYVNKYAKALNEMLGLEAPKFPGFRRTLNQLIIDRMDINSREKVRKAFYDTVRKAYEDGDASQVNFLMTDALTGKEENITSSDLRKAGDKVYSLGTLATSPVKGTDKVMVALNMNVACPMFVIGNSGCWANACYLTGMGAGNGMNYYEHSLYTGEILQLPPDVIKELNAKSGGLRVNSFGDFSSVLEGQLRDVIRDAKTVGLDLKIITKQGDTFKVLQKFANEGLDISGAIVQPSMDFLWIPIEEDLRTPGSQIKDQAYAGVDVETAVAKMMSNPEAAFEYYRSQETHVGREARMINGIPMRKYGFSVAQVNQLAKENPDVQMKPRWVLTTPQEVAEAALLSDETVFTLMHGVVASPIVSELPGGGFINFGSSRHKVVGDKLTGHKGDITATKAVMDYISEPGRYTKKQRLQILKALHKNMCCQDNQSSDACFGCLSDCALRSNVNPALQDPNIGTATGEPMPVKGKPEPNGKTQKEVKPKAAKASPVKQPQTKEEVQESLNVPPPGKSTAEVPAEIEVNAPKKTVKAYKLFRTLKTRPGELFPLFIGKTQPVAQGKWIAAEFLPTKGFAERPGWHAGVLPTAPHLMKKDGTMPEDRVWAEIEMSADIDWQPEADASRTRDIRDRVPEGGFYRFKTNKMQGGAWMIGGAIKINRLLTNEQAEAIAAEGESVKRSAAEAIDAEYMELAKDPKKNEAKLQKMVDAAARSAGYSTEKTFHGTTAEPFNVFDRDEAPDRGGIIGFVSTDLKVAREIYADQDKGTVIPLYVRMGNVFDYRNKADQQIAMDFHDETGGITDPYEIERIMGDEAKDHDFVPRSVFLKGIKEGGWDVLEAPQFVEWLRATHNINTIVTQEFAINYGFTSESQVKRSDPITRDDTGNVIPLSERFDVESPDLRRSRAESFADLFEEMELGRVPTARQQVNPVPEEAGFAAEGFIDRVMDELGPNDILPDAAVNDDIAPFLKNAETRAQTIKDLEEAGGILDANKITAKEVAARAIIGEDAIKVVTGGNKAAHKRALRTTAAYSNLGTQLGRALRIRARRVGNRMEAMKQYVVDAVTSASKKQQAAYNELFKSLSEAMAINDKKTIAKLNQQLDALLDQQVEENEKMVSKVRKLGVDLDNINYDNANEVAEAVRAIQASKASPVDQLYEYWINSILSGPQTQIANIVGNTAHAAWDFSAQRLAEATINAVTPGKGGVTYGEVFASWKAFLPSLSRAWGNAVQAFNMEQATFADEVSGSKFEAGERRVSIGGKKGRFIRIPTRLLTAADEFAKTVTASMYAAGLAHREAIRNGRDVGSHISNVLAHPTKDSPLWQRAYDESVRLAFQQEAGGLASIATGLRRQTPGARWVLPFVTTPINIFKTGLAKTPLGSLAMIVKAHRHFQTKKGLRTTANGFTYSRDQVIFDLAQQVLAFGSMAFLMSLFEPDEEDGLPTITGNVLPQRRAESYRTAPALSIRIGDTWYNYGRIEPFATALATLADMYNGWVDDQNEDKLAALQKAALGQIQEKTFVKGLNDIYKALTEGGNVLQNYAINFATSFVPNVARQPLRAADDVIRQSDYKFDVGIQKKILRRVAPGILDVPHPKVTIFGQDVTKYKGDSPLTDFFYELLSPARRAKTVDKPSFPLDRAVALWNLLNPSDQYHVPAPSNKITYRDDEGNKVKVKMTEDQYHKFMKRGGLLFMEAMLDAGFDLENIHKNPEEHAAFIRVMKKLRSKMFKVARSEIIEEIREGKK